MVKEKLSVCMRVCVCEREREREGGREMRLLEEMFQWLCF